MKRWRIFLIPTALLLVLTSCSINRMAVRTIADAVSSGESTVFTGEDDPELVADALPFALKLYETLQEQDPDNRELILASGSGYIMYSNAFIHTPAIMLPEERYLEKETMLARAKKLYLRGRDRLLSALELKYPGFMSAMENGDSDVYLNEFTEEDVPFLYWAAAGWIGAFSVDSFDFSLSLSIPRAALLMERAYDLSPDFNDGAIHDFYISYYGTLPESLGGDSGKARYHFHRAVEASAGLDPSPYVSLATTVSIMEQNHMEFRDLLTQALSIDPYTDRKRTLSAIITQRKAAWYLDHIQDFFLLEDSEMEDEP